jgi:RNA polymerase sigma-70 factor (ECF subfamily)
MDPIKLNYLLRKIVEKKDERAFSTFFDHYNTRLIKLALLFVPRFDQAEEVVSDVFFSLLRKREALLGIHHFEGYLFKMVKNKALNHLKNNKNKFSGNQLIDDVQDYLSPEINDPEKSMINDDLGKLLYKVIEQLPTKRGLVFKMVKEENMTYKQVGELLEISERTVEVHLKLAIKDLRKALSHYYHENEGIIPLSRKLFLSILL